VVVARGQRRLEVEMPAREETLPETLERSSRKIRRTYEQTLSSAHVQYGSEERAHRTAWASVKHIAKRKELRIEGRSRMDKRELAAAIRRKV
jgi:cation transport regulator ChaB